jgi:ubiquinone/menaquinone biosynthesis C-methylase UbiE
MNDHLPRVLEPEAMDTAEEAIAYDTMDHREVNRRFVEDFLAAVAATPSTADERAYRVLDLGTGTAQIPIELVWQARAAASSRRFEIAAVDLSAEMLVVAKRNVAAAEMTPVIRLERLDAKTLPYPAGRFAAVMSNSIVHHIPEPYEALAEAVRVTAPGGLLFVRDLLRPATSDEVERLVALHAAEADAGQQQLFRQSLHAALTVAEMQSLVAQLGFATDGVRATSDRHWTWSARKAP